MGKKLKYFLDHPQIKRGKSYGNGNSPEGGGFISGVKKLFGLGNTTTTAKNKPAPKSQTSGTGNIKTNLGALVSGKSSKPNQ